MPSSVLRALSLRHGLPTIDHSGIDAFLARGPGESSHALLFFAGDPAQRAETHDVAVILPELAAVFGGRLRAALVAASAEEALKARFRVYALPSLVVVRDGETVCVLPKIHDWADYIARIEAALAPDAPILAAARRPKTEVNIDQKGVGA
jgi:hydrogenase-1 operon protein HyaE